MTLLGGGTLIIDDDVGNVYLPINQNNNEKWRVGWKDYIKDDK